jgi:YHS domain-containing protein
MAAISVVLLSGCGSLSQSSAMVFSDPVCGAVVNRSRALRKVYGGRDFYFDSEKCAAEFEAHPSSYAALHSGRVGPR